MSDHETGAKKITLALGAAAALVGALVFIFFAAFPYIYAESGSARYAREHRGSAMLQVIAAAFLLWIAWRFIRRSLSTRTWLVIGGLLVGIVSLRGAASWTRRPDNVKPIGGNWHVVVVPQPGEVDTVYYNLYFKRGPHYQMINSLVAEYRRVPPDCLVYRGLRVGGRLLHAMCGYRTPVEIYGDTLIAESELLRRARSQPRYGR